MANVKFVKGKPLGKTWKKVIEEQLMKHGARLARVELTAGRQRDAERVTVRVKKIVENVVPDPDDAYDPSGKRVGKKVAGRVLDGRTWDEMPVICHLNEQRADQRNSLYADI